jgi:hypothetical protein
VLANGQPAAQSLNPAYSLIPGNGQTVMMIVFFVVIFLIVWN